MIGPNDWGLTELGFRRPSHAEILDAFEHQARERFTSSGKVPNLTVRSPFGIFLRIWAWIVNLLFQLIEDIYNSQFVDTAVGSSLYQLGRNIGLQLLPAWRSSTYELITGTPGTQVPQGLLVQTAAAIQFTIILAAVIPDSGEVLLPIQCTQTGTIGNVEAYTITELVNPIEGIESVINPSAAIGGRGRETDEQFRDRYYRSLDTAGGVNADALQGKLYNEVEGILSAKVYENDTDDEDSFKRPPHSIEAVVYGGLDQDVAETVYKKVAGIQTYGDTVVSIISPQNGQTYNIHFTRPDALLVYFRLEDVVIDQELFPANGEQLMKDALLGYVGSDLNGGLDIGQDVIYISLPCRVLAVSGVIDFNMTMGRSVGNLSKSNIAVNERQKAVASEYSITIVLPEPSGEDEGR